MYVLDTNNHQIRKIVMATGMVSTAIGSTKGYKDNLHGTENVLFEFPQGFSAVLSSDESIKKDDPHKKYGSHTDIFIYDGPNTELIRIIVLKDGKLQNIQTIEEKKKRFQEVF